MALSIFKTENEVWFSFAKLGMLVKLDLKQFENL